MSFCYHRSSTYSLLLILSFIGCSAVSCTTPLINAVYIIPDNYVGYLVIRYECPDGQPLTIKNNTIEIKYNDDGTFCTSDKITARQGFASAYMHNGQEIPFDPKDNQYGICCRQNLVIGAVQGQPEYSFMIQWVGNIAYREEYRKTEASRTDPKYNGDAFLEQRYGIKPPPDIRR